MYTRHTKTLYTCEADRARPSAIEQKKTLTIDDPPDPTPPPAVLAKTGQKTLAKADCVCGGGGGGCTHLQEVPIPGLGRVLWQHELDLGGTNQGSPSEQCRNRGRAAAGGVAVQTDLHTKTGQHRPQGDSRTLFTKGLQLELGNVVTGEGERGESGSWRLDG